VKDIKEEESSNFPEITSLKEAGIRDLAREITP